MTARAQRNPAGIGSTYRTYRLTKWLRVARNDASLWLRINTKRGKTLTASPRDYSWAKR